MKHPTSDAVRVPDRARMRFLPDVFRGDMLVTESLIFRLADKHIEGYGGGYWHFWRLPDDGGWLAPDAERVMFLNPDNGFEAEISGDAAGIILTSLAINRRHWHHEERGNGFMCHLMVKRAGALETVIAAHAESALIRRALD